MMKRRPSLHAPAGLSPQPGHGLRLPPRGMPVTLERGARRVLTSFEPVQLDYQTLNCHSISNEQTQHNHTP
jgi:hypothetical protein